MHRWIFPKININNLLGNLSSGYLMNNFRLLCQIIQTKTSVKNWLTDLAHRFLAREWASNSKASCSRSTSASDGDPPLTKAASSANCIKVSISFEPLLSGYSSVSWQKESHNSKTIGCKKKWLQGLMYPIPSRKKDRVRRQWYWNTVSRITERI